MTEQKKIEVRAIKLVDELNNVSSDKPKNSRFVYYDIKTDAFRFKIGGVFVTDKPALTKSVFVEYVLKDEKNKIAELESDRDAFVDAMIKRAKAIYKRNDKVTEPVITHDDGLNEWTVENLLWWLRMTKVATHDVRFVIKPRRAENTYSLLIKDDPISIVQSMIDFDSAVDPDVKLFTRIRENFKKQFERKFAGDTDVKISFYDKYYKAPKGEGDEPELKVPSILKYLTDNWNEIQTSELMVISGIEMFSNDISVPAYSHIDLDRLNAPAGGNESVIVGWLRSVFRQDQIDVLRAYLYGIFVADFDSRQTVYIEDQRGKTGKSTFIHAFTEYLDSFAPDIYTAMNTKSFSSQFAFKSFLNKRLAIESDVKNAKIAMTDVFHKITGGDTVSVEAKGVDAFTARVQCKVLMMGNISLELNTSNEHETSRMIYLVMTEMSEDYLKTVAILNADGTVNRSKSGSYRYEDPKAFKQALSDEMPSFIANSREFYEQYSNGTEISVPTKIVDDMFNRASSENMLDFSEFAESHLDFADAGSDEFKELELKTADLKVAWRNVSHDRSSFTFAELKKYLETTRHVEFKRGNRRHSGHGQFNGARGVRLKDNIEVF